jgi:photosystem II stability/assembly factor-like uncharacterized protein
MKVPGLPPRWTVMLAVSALALASLACSAIARSTPAVPGKSGTPTGSQSPTPSALTQAKAGHWEGTPSVSFDVAANGDIRNFKMISFIGTVRCTVEIKEIPAQAAGGFVYTALIKEDNYWPGADRASLRAKNVWPTPVMTGDGPMVEAIRINGTLNSSTALSGTFKILVCGNTQMLPAEGKGVETWGAAWKSAIPAGTPTKSAQPPAQTVVVVTRAPQPSPSPTTSEPLADTPTATEPPATGVPEETPSSAGSWQPLPDLPRQINALVADPANPHMLYAGTGSSGAGSGVYKSEDAGLTWRTVSTGLPNVDVAALAFSYDTPPVLYAASGQNVFASADGGASWSQQAKGVGNNRGFRQIRVAPSDGKVLYGITVIEGAFRSDDGGRNWAAINQGLPQDNNGSHNVQSVVIDSTDSNVVYVGTGWGPSNGNGVYKSTDGGKNWAAANRGMIDYSITALAINPDNPQTIYAGGNSGELFKSADGGATWDNLTAKLPTASANSRSALRAIILDPLAPQTVYVLGEREGVMVSTDGGGMWRLLGKPGKFDYPTFTALSAVFDPQLILVAGIKGEGGWRYAVDGASQAAPSAAQPAQAAAQPTPTPTKAAQRTALTDNLVAITPSATLAAPQPTFASAPSPSAQPPLGTRPAARPQPMPSAQPSPGTPTPPPANCPDQRAVITSPTNGATIQGIVPFVGIANVTDLAYYKFEYKPADAPTWQFLTQVDGKSVTGDKLMDFYTTTIAPGIYDFRLLVVDQTGNYPPPCEIRVTVQR